MSKPAKALFLCVIFSLLSVIGYSSFQLSAINRDVAQESQVREWSMQYRPVQSLPTSTSAERPNAVSTSQAVSISQEVNQSIVDLQAAVSDVVGWLTVPNTMIDYPFLQGADNYQYLHLDLNHGRSAAGSVFMDVRNHIDFSDFHSILYGHNMRSGSMFGSLQRFNDQAFFDLNKTGHIFLAHRTYEIEFMAFAVVAPDDAMMYNPMIVDETDKLAFLDYVASTARYYRDIGITVHDRMVTLSTCNYEFDDARMVLIGRLRNPQQ
ncbi:MAG: class B sortase [Oscillospiraceae bacterium]|nr:class B sortase [Oscillospiraceae bacterium]